MQCSSRKCACRRELNSHNAAKSRNPRCSGLDQGDAGTGSARGPNTVTASGSLPPTRSGSRWKEAAVLRGKRSLALRRQCQSVRLPAATGVVVASLSVGSRSRMTLTPFGRSGPKRASQAKSMASCGLGSRRRPRARRQGAPPTQEGRWLHRRSTARASGRITLREAESVVCQRSLR